MTRSEAAQALLEAAHRDLGVREDPPGSNRGPRINQMLANVGEAPGASWCAAAVSTWGMEALGDQWPLPRTSSCDTLLDFGRRKGILYLSPQAADVFLVRASADDATHTGLAAGAGDGLTFPTWEGNSNAGGAREGLEVVSRPARSIRPSGRPQVVFLRWLDLWTPTVPQSAPVYGSSDKLADAQMVGGVAVLPVRGFLSNVVSADTVAGKLTYDVRDNLLLWGGKPMAGVTPILRDGAVWASVRQIARWLGLGCEWDNGVIRLRLSTFEH